MSSPSPALSFTALRLQFSIQRPGRLIHFPGSAWRGALGHQLRRIACITGATECTGCSQRATCGYSYLFETPVTETQSIIGNYQDAPAPYVLYEQQSEPSSLDLYCTLIGRSTALWPLMHQSLIRAGSTKFGVAGRALTWHRTEAWSEAQSTWHVIDPLQPQSAPVFNPIIPPLPQTTLKIIFLTPMRMRRQGKNIRPDTFSFADWFSNLLRRLSLLSEFHQHHPIEADFHGLTQAAKAVVLQRCNLKWVEQIRHSTRQDTDMQIGGLVGEIYLNPNELADFWPYLWLGQFTHAGRSTTMGLGRYTIEAASLPIHPALR